jgi:ribosome-associated heat shock protein Hsp15
VAQHERRQGLGDGVQVRASRAVGGVDLDDAHGPWEHGAVGEAPVRIDKWLWAARLYKTRGLAAEAVTGGRVHVDGHAVKPSRDVRPGDRLEVTTGPVRRRLVVLGTAERRGPAPEAALLYEETPESREARERQRAESRVAGQQSADLGARPTKRDRRRYERATGGRGGRSS